MAEIDEETAEDLRDAISDIYHDLNNPLSIISGNAQFLIELSREQEMGDQVEASAEDIQEAARRMSNSLKRLDQLREGL
jgi:signal transduction histidine kinase